MARERILSHIFEDAIDVARDIETDRRLEREEREAKRPRGSSSHSGAPSMGQFQQSRGRSYRPHQSARPKYHGPSSVQGSSAPSAPASHSGARGSFQSHPPASRGCYECGELGHVWKQCPRRTASSSQQRGQSSSSAPTTSAPTQSARASVQAERSHLVSAEMVKAV
uniref:CCHC-type domain-containing protein n=1 Tax=Nicotiana sylvestris TaxID=4096 RepID=A0A1U7WGW8_NICSY|nr:PREDICTED: putative protein TPRXL [Nicotiana sylvestris]